MGFVCKDCQIAGWPELPTCPICAAQCDGVEFTNLDALQSRQIDDAIKAGGWAEFYPDDTASAYIWWTEVYMGLNKY